MEEDKSPFVTITSGVRGYFAVIVWWNEEEGGFWEPWNSGFGSYETYDEAIPEAKMIAEAEELRLEI